MKKFLLTLFCMLAIGIFAYAAPTTVSLNKEDIGDTEWTSTYSDHTYDYKESGVTILSFSFTKFGIQTTTVKDCPVTKQGTIIVTANNNKYFKTAAFNFKQWGTKTKTAVLKYSTDGGETWQAFSPNISQTVGTTKQISTGEITIAKVNAIQLSFIDTKNQIGVESFEFEFQDAKTDIGLKFMKDGAEVVEESTELTKKEDYVAPTLTRDDGFDEIPVNFESSDENVAKISAEGKLEIVGLGHTTISASVPDTHETHMGSASYILHVTKKVLPLAFTPTAAKYDLDDKNAFVAPTLSGNIDGVNIVYSSSNEAVATVDNQGVITAIAPGTTTITAKVTDEDATYEGTASYTLTVYYSSALTIVFNSNKEDGSDDIKDTSEIESGSEYVENFTGISKVYAGINGLKFSSSSKNGKLTINLVETVKCKQIIVNAQKWGSDSPSLSIDNVSNAIDAEKDYTFDMKSTNINSITLAATKRLYVKSITIVVDPTPDAPVLELPAGATEPMPLDNYTNAETNNYFEVKVSWPEGLTLHYETNCRGTQLDGVTLPYSEKQKALDFAAGNNADKTLTDPLTGDLTGAAAVSRSAGTNTATFGFASQGTFECYVVDAAGNQSDKKPLTFQGQSTGVEDIVADGEKGEAVFFNMQGVRVANPAAGNLYIKVQGDKATKVLVK